ncbi:DNA translocase FtsK [Brevirhabdus sp.]|uniref:DNA translocase FtsK n=1 Tax=Brevirhabdus sp. TaxID=2004514 RepID=UPI004058798C
MASYQARPRDPLLDRNTQAALERRGKELLGLGLVAVGVFVALILATYVPEDPSWLSATDAPAQNIFGRFGASIASPLFVIVGWGGWAIALTFFVWGIRFVLHKGEQRALSRAIFAPIAIALASIYASTHVPDAGWTHSFGLGGLFGDTVLGAVLGVTPISATFGLKMLSLLFGAAMIAMAFFVLGFTWEELRRLGRWMLVGFILTYANLLSLFARLGGGAASAATQMNARRNERRAARVSHDYDDYDDCDEDELIEDEAQGYPGEAERKPGLLSRLPSLVRRSAAPTEPALEPELVEPPVSRAAQSVDQPSDDRIKEKIASVIKSRVRRSSGGGALRAEPPVVSATRHRQGRAPLIAGRPAADAAAAVSGPQDMAFSPEHSDEWRAWNDDEAEILRDREEDASAEGYGSFGTFDEGAAYDGDHDEGRGARYQDGLSDDRPDAGAGSGRRFSGKVERGPLPEGVSPTAAASAAPPAPQMARPPSPAAARSVVQHAPRRRAQPSRRATAEAQPDLRFDEAESTAYEHPPLSLLTSPDEIERLHLSDEALEENARMLESVLDDYGVKGEIVSVRPGPVVTMYELEPAPGLKASRVIGLADDIARSMSALSARVSTVPGRSVIGIELPNAQREKVMLREILSHRDFGDGKQSLPLALGKDIGGAPVVVNLAKMPHLLIAGTTGSGKSVAINTMILSLLYKLTPDECRLIMIDPKMLELSVYDGIPHLLSPVVTDPKKAVVALKWVVGEMEDRYRKMSKMGVRNIEGYNGRVRDALAKDEMFSRTVQTGFDDDTGEPVFETEEFQPEVLPFIVVVVDEMADLMMVAGKEIEACIQRLAQMARASGIHLIMATQRPSVDVITGTIKANFPTRISFQVTSKIDSRTILGEQGAEQLLGMGDMLYMAGGSRIVRVHGPFCSDEEVEEIVNYLKDFGPPEYVGGVVDGPDDDKESDIDLVLGLGGNTDGEDALYDTAVAIVIKDRKCSTSYIQRKLAIGYNKAARLVEQMEEEGLVSAANHVGKREILVPEQS